MGLAVSSCLRPLSFAHLDKYMPPAPLTKPIARKARLVMLTLLFVATTSLPAQAIHRLELADIDHPCCFFARFSAARLRRFQMPARPMAERTSFTVSRAISRMRSVPRTMISSTRPVSPSYCR